MNIVIEQRGENNSLIRVTVGEADYGQEVEKSSSARVVRCWVKSRNERNPCL